MPELQSLMDVCQTDAIAKNSIKMLRVYLHPQLGGFPGICISSKASKVFCSSELLFNLVFNLTILLLVPAVLKNRTGFIQVWQNLFD